MDQALHVIKVSQYDGFGDVQTSLFSNRMVTCVFPNDNEIPAEMAREIQERFEINHDLLSTAYVNDETAFISVETYGFQDAAYVHATVGKIVEDFISSHERVVTWVKR